MDQGGFGMARKRHSAEDIVNKLREAEVLIANGTTIALVCKQIGVTDQAKRFKELEHENARLKKLVADLALDKAMLQDVARGNF